MIGKCPRCSNAVVEGENSYFCRSSDCGFKIAKTILGEFINPVQATNILTGKRTDLLNGFISKKTGKPFSAYLVMDNSGKISFDFPPHEGDMDSERRDKDKTSHELIECKTLLNAATKTIFRSNAFRITGLPVDATTRQIAKHVDKLKIVAELGQSYPGELSAFALKPAPTLDHVREAIQKLKDPGLRIIDELFWFWPDKSGNGETDPALTAVARGEPQTALDIWMQRESDHPNEVIARHNLWVYSQMMAIEFEGEFINGNFDDSKCREADTHWQKASIRFNGIYNDAQHWERLEDRIRAIDDVRLKGDFARQIKVSLPKALAKISAELAHVHSQKGNTSRAYVQIRFARDAVGKNDADEILQVLLASDKSRVQELAKRAREHSERDPSNGNKSLYNLIESAKPFLETFDLFLGEENYVRNDLFDEVAGACADCAVGYQKKTGDDQVFLMLLENALPYAVSSEMRQRIDKNIAIARTNLAHKKLQPIHEKLSGISKDGSTPRVKLARINAEVVSDLGYYSTAVQLPTEVIDDFSNSIAAALRSVSIDSYNVHGDADTALEAIDQAIRLAKDQELLKRLDEDRNQLLKLKREQDSHNLSLSIRNDRIEVTSKGFQYNSTNLPVASITGLKFGIFTQYTNGAKASVSYAIGLFGAGHGSIEIECKRFFAARRKPKWILMPFLILVFII